MPSLTDGCEPFSQPGACVPQRRVGTQNVGILMPGLSGHISSSFDQYLPHYGQNPQERNS